MYRNLWWIYYVNGKLKNENYSYSRPETGVSDHLCPGDRVVHDVAVGGDPLPHPEAQEDPWVNYCSAVQTEPVCGSGHSWADPPGPAAEKQGEPDGHTHARNSGNTNFPVKNSKKGPLPTLVNKLFLLQFFKRQHFTQFYLSLNYLSFQIYIQFLLNYNSGFNY